MRADYGENTAREIGENARRNTRRKSGGMKESLDIYAKRVLAKEIVVGSYELHVCGNLSCDVPCEINTRCRSLEGLVIQPGSSP